MDADTLDAKTFRVVLVLENVGGEFDEATLELLIKDRLDDPTLSLKLVEVDVTEK
jgi:hypothetical protein